MSKLLSKASRDTARMGLKISPLRRLWDILRFESGGLGVAVAFQILQPLTYLPFFAGVGILVDDILQTPALTTEQRYRYIVYYALATLA